MALKRAADAEWETSAPNAPKNDVPQLNDDCIRLLLELALGQRTRATYGADGRVVESRDYYGSPYWPATHFWHGSIHTFRRVCRQWNKIASSLVRVVIIREEMSPASIMYLPTLFPNASTIDWSRNTSFPDRASINRGFDAHRHIIMPKCPSCTFDVYTDNSNPRDIVRNILARNNTIVRNIHAKYGLTQGLCSEFHVYRFRSWQYFYPTLNLTESTNLVAGTIVTVFVEEGDPTQHYDTCKIISRLTESLVRAQAAGILQHIQLHLMIDSCDRADFILDAQAFFPRKFVIHTSFKASRRSGSPFHKRSSFAPNVFFDAHMYRALWASQGLIEPLV